MVLVRLAARDPGGANVLAPLVAEWAGADGRKLEAWTMPRATPVLAAAGVRCLEFAEDTTDATLRARWA